METVLETVLVTVVVTVVHVAVGTKGGQTLPTPSLWQSVGIGSVTWGSGGGIPETTPEITMAIKVMT